MDQRAHTTRPLRSVLIAVELGPNRERVIDRAALLSLAPNASVTLLHVAAKLRLPTTRRRLESEARAALRVLAARLAGSISPTISISSIVAFGFAGAQIVECARAVNADLVVMGCGGRRAARDMVVGSITSRVIRHVKRPVLVVHPSVGTYRRPALALDFDDRAAPAVRFLLRLLGPLPPPVALIHAHEAPIEALVYPTPSPEALARYRDQQRALLSRRLARLLPGEELRCTRHVLHGAPRTIIAGALARLDCDLLVIGTHARSGLARACLGSVALDVMADAPCDVLVIPPGVS